jgi:HAD superfamily phosphoserine phosphatase-like hydrolase
MKIVYVDFDETLVTSNSFHYLYAIRRRVISIEPKAAMFFWFMLMMVLAPLLILSHFISGSLRDQLSYFFYRGLSEAMIRKLAADYFTENSQLLRRPLVEWLRERKREGYQILIVSGSVTQVVEAAIQAYQLEELVDHVLTTRLVFARGKAQGCIQGLPLVGRQKVNVVRAFEGTSRVTQRLVVTDSMSDRPLLEFATEAVVVNPKARLRRYALARNWRVWEFPPSE